MNKERKLYNSIRLVTNKRYRSCASLGTDPLISALGCRASSPASAPPPPQGLSPSVPARPPAVPLTNARCRRIHAQRAAASASPDLASTWGGVCEAGGNGTQESTGPPLGSYRCVSTPRLRTSDASPNPSLRCQRVPLPGMPALLLHVGNWAKPTGGSTSSRKPSLMPV